LIATQLVKKERSQCLMTVTSGALPKIKTTLSSRIFVAYKKLTWATYDPTLVSRSNMLLQSQK
jgi:hypothetical protein